MQDKDPVIYIVGPTASGKTGLSVEVAKHFGGEILSADSMQIYKGMHIASAAPDKAEKQDVPHHLFEFLDPAQSFSVSQYVKLADGVIADIISRNKLPFVVGGTGLYISALAEHIDFGEDEAKEGLRQAITERFEKEGAEAMYEYLRSIDPASAEKISVNDKKRIIRAIEIFETAGITKSSRDAESKRGGAIYDNLIIGLTYNDRDVLYDRINRRVDIMLQNGLLKEAESAYKNIGGTAAQAIGHKELFKYFENELTLEEAVEHLKMQTRRYAKRQLTWFRKTEGIRWIYMDEDPNPADTACKLIAEHIK